MATGDNKEVMSRKDSFMNRMKGKYPDKPFDDDEAVFGQISDDYDEYDKQLSDYKGREQQFSDMFSSDPRSAAFLMGWKNGGDPAVELVRQFGTDIKEAIDDPTRQEQIAAANKEFVDRVAKEKKLEEEYNKNIAESLKVMQDIQQKNGLTDDQVDQAMDFIIKIVKDGVVGIFSAETIDMAMKAINHDSDVATAEREAEVRGKNTRVAETLRKPKMGDGTAQLNGKNGTSVQPKRGNSIFSLAEQAR